MRTILINNITIRIGNDEKLNDLELKLIQEGMASISPNPDTQVYVLLRKISEKISTRFPDGFGIQSKYFTK